MKNSILSLALIALITFSCSKEEITNAPDQNLTIKKDTPLTNLMRGIQADQDLRDFLISKSTSNQRNGDHGAMLLSDGYWLGYFAFDGATFSIIYGTGTITALPNGRARFSVHTNNPGADVFDLVTGTGYSSACVDGPLGTFNYNLISEYEEFSFEPFPGEIFTFYFPTYVNASAEVANGHCNISDALPIYDENWEIVGCGDATEFLTIRLTPHGITLE